MEQAVLLGQMNTLVGVINDPPPQSDEVHLPAFVFLNAGLVHHVGPNRLYVTAARRLAALGFVGLRFDFSGIGDSPVRADHLPFDRSAVSEVSEAIQWLSVVRSVDRFILMGICSGATFALQAACAEPRVAGVVLINFQGPVEARSYVSHRAATHYSWRVSLFSARSWTKLLTGKADYRGIARSIVTKLSDLFVRSERRTPEAQADRERIWTLLERGVRVFVIYSVGDPGWDYLRMALGDWERHKGASENFVLEMIPRADHTFTTVESQQSLLRLIDDWALRLRDP